MRATTELPDDPALPALTAIRTLGLAAAVTALALTGRPAVLLRGYTPRSRATIEARVGNRRFAVKAYADDPAPEAELYERSLLPGWRATRWSACRRCWRGTAGCGC